MQFACDDAADMQFTPDRFADGVPILCRLAVANDIMTLKETTRTQFPSRNKRPLFFN